ncbi:hypothetical protein CONPUDRAFT_152812 [Coniophora puteana RWD-64-598 SS2]|uniref:Uncharacterized protein n=1 Tax=Coniophora puteana (strain RWD-64-598) TaxID=741705 RepID=A0A5M3MS48_CONPW|nr:uncharacterized protein CONPUDRAFT_152812 [Coniophora puteana RWD-64-598 SS2]EIW81916.1 hypothetical protein CONPUDRAFT_152812 [Coniophora puteana RWD-64-598 SS2]
MASDPLSYNTTIASYGPGTIGTQSPKRSECPKRSQLFRMDHITRAEYITHLFDDPVGSRRYLDSNRIYTQAVIIATVQAFYAYRLWIITNKNVWITSVVFTVACVGFVLGIADDIYDIADNSDDPAAHTAFVILVASTFMVCDVLISISVFYFLRPARTSVATSARRIVYISNVTINMGFLTTAFALLTVVLYGVPPLQAYAAIPLTFIPKCNCLLVDLMD